MMFGNVPATTASPPTRVAASSPVEQHTSDAGANLAHVANRPRAAEIAGGILERIRSGLQHMFEGARNLRNLFAGGVRHEAANRMPVDLAPNASELLFEAGSSSLLNAIPTLTSMLQSGVVSRQDCDEFAAAFRTMGVGVRAFERLLATPGVDLGTAHEAVVAQIRALIAPTTLIANGETEGRVYDRLVGNTSVALLADARVQDEFLADARVQNELLGHLQNVRDAAVAVADLTGRADIARQLDALCRQDQMVAPDVNRAASGNAQSRQSSSQR